MILYELKCASGHGFEGWFRNSDTYDLQALAGEISCPVCHDTQISKAPMAPRVARPVKAPQAEAETNSPAAPASTAEGNTSPPALPVPAVAPSGPPLPQHMQAMHFLRTLRRVVESHCENVGDSFAEEARAIHEGDAPVRGIYGETTPEKAEELSEEGIEFLQIPWLRISDA